MGDIHIGYIKNNFAFLDSLNFKVRVETTKPMFDGDVSDKEVYYSSKAIQVRLWFAKFVNGKLLTISISRIGENKCFSFDEYLLSRNMGDSKSLEQEDEQAYIARIANLFRNELSGDLGDVIQGNKWIEVPKDYSRIR